MVRYTTETGLLYHTPKDGKKKSLYSWCQPYSFADSQEVGYFFGVVEIYLSNNFWANSEVLKILSQIEQKFNDLLEPNLSTEKNLEKILAFINGEIENVIVQKSLPLESEKINALLGLVEENDLSFAPVGNINAYLIHRVKKYEHLIVNILEKTPSATTQFYSSKMFANVLSAKLSSLDTVIFCNENVLNYLSLNKIQQVVTTYSAAEAVHYLKEQLCEMNARTNFAGLVIKLNQIIENTISLNRPAPAKPPHLSVVNTRPNVTPLGSQQSLERLLSTQDATEKILSPSLKPELQKLTQKTAELTKLGWQALASRWKKYSQSASRKAAELANEQAQVIQARIDSLKAKQNSQHSSQASAARPDFITPQAVELSQEELEKVESPISEKIEILSESEAAVPLPENELPDFLQQRLQKIPTALPSDNEPLKETLGTPEEESVIEEESFAEIPPFKEEAKFEKEITQTKPQPKLASQDLNPLALEEIPSLSEQAASFSEKLHNLSQPLKTASQTTSQALGRFWQILKPFSQKLANQLVKLIRQSAAKISFLSPKIAWLEKTNDALNLLLEKFSAWPQPVRKNVLIFAGVLFIFLQSLVWQGMFKQTQAEQTQWNENIALARNYFVSSETKLLAKDETGAQADLTTAQALLQKQKPHNWQQYQQTKTVKQELIAAQAKVFKKYVIDQPELIYDFGSQGQINSFTKIENNLYLLDAKNSQILSLDLNQRQSKTLLTDKNLSFATGLKPLTTKLLYLKNNGNLWEFDRDKNVLNKIVINPPANDATDFEFFNQRLYFLAPLSNQINRYSRQGAGFANSQAILRNPPNLNQAVSLAIDNAIYILQNNGQVVKFVSGRISDFSQPRLEPALATAVQITTSAELNWLYILDSQNSRVIVLDKTGQLKMQYQLNNVAGLQEMIVSPADHAIYLLGQNKLYKFTALE